MSTERKIQVWRISKESRAGIEITENTATLAGSRDNFVGVHPAGVTLWGKSLSFGTVSENQRHALLFVKMNDFVQMIPTTLVTLAPNNMPYNPLGFASTLKRDLPFFIAMLAVGPIASQIVKTG